MDHDQHLNQHVALPTMDEKDAPLRIDMTALHAAPPAPPQVSYVSRTKVDNLDALDNEAPDEPYHFELRGQTFSMISPKDADWVDISAAAENPRLLVHILMGDDDRNRFLALGKVRVRVLQGLMERYQKHFGTGDQGESGGSARS